MRWEPVIHWMTQVAEGSWTSFRRVVDDRVAAEEDSQAVARRLRLALGDLAVSQFFVAGGQRWETLPPFLGRLHTASPSAQFCGGRVPSLMKSATEAAAECGCTMTSVEVSEGLSAFRLSGAEDGLLAAATRLRVKYVHDAPRALCNFIVPISQQLSSAPVEEPLGNWSARYMDLDRCNWSPEPVSGAACELRSEFGVTRYYLERSPGLHVRLPKREAIYASALLAHASLASYDLETKELSCPAACPLPEPYSRVASMCSGSPPTLSAGRFRHSDVSPMIATLILSALGQGTLPR